MRFAITWPLESRTALVPMPCRYACSCQSVPSNDLDSSQHVVVLMRMAKRVECGTLAHIIPQIFPIKWHLHVRKMSYPTLQMLEIFILVHSSLPPFQRHNLSFPPSPAITAFSRGQKFSFIPHNCPLGRGKNGCRWKSHSSSFRTELVRQSVQLHLRSTTATQRNFSEAAAGRRHRNSFATAMCFLHANFRFRFGRAVPLTGRSLKRVL